MLNIKLDFSEGKVLFCENMLGYFWQRKKKVLRIVQLCLVHMHKHEH